MCRGPARESADMRERDDPRVIVDRVRAICASASTLGLATIGIDGSPHAANVNFAEDENLDLYFLSHPATVHSADIARDPRVAATAYAPFDGARQVRGIQIRGRCAQMPGGAFNRVWQLFVRKFPYSAGFEERARSERFYRIRASWFRVIDNSVVFGTKWEIDWPPR
jgi:uncharacterized protein YhbP (UPF0306 family)